MSELAAIESAKHGCLGRGLHRQIVVRAAPGLILRRVALGTGIRSDPSFRLPVSRIRRVGGGRAYKKENGGGGKMPADPSQGKTPRPQH